MNKKTEILTITDDTSGDAIRSHIVGIMKDLQNIRSNVDNLKNFTMIFEIFESELKESTAHISGLNNLMGNIIGSPTLRDLHQ